LFGGMDRKMSPAWGNVASNEFPESHYSCVRLAAKNGFLRFRR
jgi:hypothetical protein